MTNLPRLALLGLAISLGLAASGAPLEAREGRPGFEALDANSDGQLTKAELDAYSAARFAAADTDGDGALSRAELEAQGAEHAGKRAARMIERLDADKDGALSQDELAQARRGGDRSGRMFERADANSDGVITKAEFDTLRERSEKRHKN